MARVIISLLALLASTAYGQNAQTTPMPPNITIQPTDLLLYRNLATNLRIVLLPTQGFAVEYTLSGSSATASLSIPCAAVANPQAVKYVWYKWNPQVSVGTKWQGLTVGSKFTWSTQNNGDLVNAGMLTIKPYDKVADAGLYVCWSVSEHGTAVSQVLNLTAAVFPNEGQQAGTQAKSYLVGDYVRLDVPALNTVPALVTSWTRTGSAAVPAGTGREIPSDRVVVDENGSLHIGYIDNSLLQIQTSTGVTTNNFYHYMCMSLRDVMTDLAVFQLALSGTAPATAQCALQYQTRTLSLLHGQRSRIACAFSGSPTIKVSYQKLDSSNSYRPLTTLIITTDDSSSSKAQTGLYGNTYLIGSAQTTDAGTYLCQATYAAGPCQGVVSPIVVTVDLEPIFVSQPNPIVYVTEGDSITLEWRVKGRPKPVFELFQNGQALTSTDSKITGTEPAPITDPTDGYPIYIRTMKLSKASKPYDSISVQLVATNPYYMAVSSVSITVISPISFLDKILPQLAIQPSSVATFTCSAKGDDALPLSITWTRVSTLAITTPLYSSSDDAQFVIVENAVSPQVGFGTISSTLTVNTAKGLDKDASRGQYVCNVTNGVSSSYTAARLSFVGDDPVAASFEMWMLGPILGGVAAILLVVGIIIVVRRNRGEKYEVEDEEIKKGYDPKKEAHEQRELREYQRDREKDTDEPLRQSYQDADIEREDDA